MLPSIQYVKVNQRSANLVQQASTIVQQQNRGFCSEELLLPRPFWSGSTVSQNV